MLTKDLQLLESFFLKAVVSSIWSCIAERTNVPSSNTLGTGFKRFSGSLDGVAKQGKTYLTDTLPQRYSLANPNLASTIPLILFDMPPDPLC